MFRQLFPTRQVFDIDYYCNYAKQLENAGAASICIKDMAGLLTPYGTYDLVKALKETVKIPIQLHTHYTSGLASMVLLKGIEAGVDVIDTAMSPLAMGTSQPNLWWQLCRAQSMIQVLTLRL